MKNASRTGLVVSLLTLSVIATADSLNSIKNPSRAFGYTLGDVLEQKIPLSIDGTVETLQLLPPEQREGRWVTRSAVSVSPDNQWLTLQYQIINAPTDVRVITLPSLTLATDNELSIDVPAWSFSVAPLLPMASDADEQLPVLQPDQLSQPPTSTSLWSRLTMLVAGLLCWLSVWLGWWLWRNWREAHALPFANAYRTVRTVGSTAGIENNAGWLAMHNAFNQSAGRSIINSTVSELSQNCTWLKPFESEISTFYTLSSTRFFAPDSQPESFNLTDFSKRLFEAEKRHTTKISNSTRLVQSAS